MRINNRLVIILIFICSPLLAEEESIWEKAKRNAAPDVISSEKPKTKHTNDQSFPMQVFSSSEDAIFPEPILLKIIVPWGEDRPVASIHYKGGEAPYRVGDFVPPFYRVMGITPNMVSLKCLAEKKEDKERCITELSFSGVY